MPTYGISGWRAGLGSVFITSGTGSTSMVSDVGAIPDPSTSALIIPTGVSATGQAGTFSIEIDKGLTGVQGTAQVGTILPGFHGIQATGQVGSFTPAISANITGVAATGQAGTLTSHSLRSFAVSPSHAGIIATVTPMGNNTLKTYMVGDVGTLFDGVSNIPNTTSISTASLTLTPQAFTVNASQTVSLSPDAPLTLTPQAFVVDEATLISLSPEAPLTLMPQAFTWTNSFTPVVISFDPATLILDAIPFTFNYVLPFLHLTQEGVEVATVAPADLRQTQTSIEAAIVGETDLRQTQTSIEVSMSSPTDLRQTQTSVEVSIGISAVPFRFAQLAIEVMHGLSTTRGWNADNIFVTPVYPALLGLAFNVKREIFFHTTVQPQISGKEVRVGSWSQATYAYELVYELLRDFPNLQEYLQLEAFWNNQTGVQGVFLFDDPDDDQRTGQIIGVGDGKQTQYQLKRTYGSYDDYVFAPNVVSAVYIGGILQDPTTYALTYWGSNLPGVLAFHAAVPVDFIITVDFTYYWPCHFTEDTTTFEKFMAQLWEDKSVRFETIKSNNVLLLPYPVNFTNAATILYTPS